MAFPVDPIDLEVGLFLDGIWVDANSVGNGVLERDPVTISQGRANWSARTETGKANFTLDNRDGRWSPDNPAGAYFGFYKRNIPTRIGIGVGDNHLATTDVSADVASTPDIAGPGGGGGLPTAPGFSSVTQSSETTATTLHTVAMPAVLAATDRLLLLISAGHASLAATDQGGGATDLDDWTLVHSGNLYSPWHGWLVYEIELDTALASALAGGNVEFSTSVSVLSSAHVLRTTAARSGGEGTAWDYAVTGSTTFDAAPDPPSLTAPWGADEHRWYAFAIYGSGGDSVSTYPTSYTSIADSDTTTNLPIASAHRTTAVATEDPGAYALTGDENWQALTFVYRAIEDTGDDGVLDISGDIDLRIELQLEEDPGDIVDFSEPRFRLAHKRSGADGWEWDLYRFDGALHMGIRWWDSSSVAHRYETLGAGASLPLSVLHDRMALRVTLDVNNGAVDSTARFYQAPSIDGTWTEIGTGDTGEGVTNIATNDAPLRVGGAPSDNAHVPLPGKIYAFELRDGIDGTVVADPDFTAQTIADTSINDTAGRTWTIGTGGRITNMRWRFHGELASLPVRWDTQGRDVTAPVEANGLFRRLRQGQRRLESAIRRAIIRSGTNLVQYWPMEEAGQQITRYGAAVGTNPLVVSSGFPNAASDSTFLASDALPTLASSQVTALVDSYATADAWQLRWLQLIPEGFTSTEVTFFTALTSDMDWHVQFRDTDGGQFRVLAFRGLTQVYASAWVSFFATGTPFRMSLTVEQNGTNVNVTLLAQEPGAALGAGISATSAVAGSAGQVEAVNINGGLNVGDWVFGHLTLQSVRTPSSELATELDAYDNEKAGTRIMRLCREEGIATRIEGDPSLTEAMGPQRAGTLIELLEECADTDLGILHEARDSIAVAYRTRESMIDQDTTTVDTNALYFNGFTTTGLASVVLGSEWELYNANPGNAGFGVRDAGQIEVVAEASSTSGSGNVLRITAEDVGGEHYHGGLKLLRPLTYGQYELRVRCSDDASERTTGVVLLWPASGEILPEVDWWESFNNRDTRTPVESVVHRPRPGAFAPYVTADDQVVVDFTHTGVDQSDWHKIVCTWTIDELSIEIDNGPKVFLTTNAGHIPDEPMELAIQLDAWSDTPPASPITLDVDYVLLREVTAPSSLIALDYGAGEIAAPLQPDRDDQRFANDITVENTSGATARAELDDGSDLSVSEPPTGAGRYDTTFRVNGQDTRLQALADSRLVLSAVDEARISRLALALHHPTFVNKPALTAAVLDSSFGDLITVDNNLPEALGAVATIRQLIQGARERIENFQHRIDLLTSPASPWLTAGGGDVTPPPAAHSVTFRSQDTLSTAGTPPHVLTALGYTGSYPVTRAQLDGILDDWVASTGGTTHNVTSAATWTTAMNNAEPGDLVRATAGFDPGGNITARGDLYGIAGSNLTATNGDGGNPGLPIIVTCADGVYVDDNNTSSNTAVLDFANCRHVWAVGFNVRDGQFGIRCQNWGGSAGFPAYIAYCDIDNIGDAGLAAQGWFQTIAASGGTAPAGAGNEWGFSEFFVFEENTIDGAGVRLDQFGEGIYLGRGSTPGWVSYCKDAWVRGNNAADWTSDGIDIKPGCYRINLTDDEIHTGHAESGAPLSICYVNIAVDDRPTWFNFDPEIYVEGMRVYDNNLTNTDPSSVNIMGYIGLSGIRIAHCVFWAHPQSGTHATWRARNEKGTNDTEALAEFRSDPTWIINCTCWADDSFDPGGYGNPFVGPFPGTITFTQRNNLIEDSGTATTGETEASSADFIATVPAIGVVGAAEWETYGNGSAFDLALTSDLIAAGASIADLGILISQDISQRDIPATPNVGAFQPHPANV